ncbi:putative reverse transcriptase domain, aspartic peptidase domain protein [Tanacetum coccineum]
MGQKQTRVVVTTREQQCITPTHRDNNRNSGAGRDQRNRGQPSSTEATNSGISFDTQGEEIVVVLQGGTCFKCGQAGFLQRDCKKNSGVIRMLWGSDCLCIRRQLKPDEVELSLPIDLELKLFGESNWLVADAVSRGISKLDRTSAGKRVLYNPLENPVWQWMKIYLWNFVIRYFSSVDLAREVPAEIVRYRYSLSNVSIGSSFTLFWKVYRTLGEPSSLDGYSSVGQTDRLNVRFDTGGHVGNAVLPLSVGFHVCVSRVLEGPEMIEVDL